MEGLICNFDKKKIKINFNLIFQQIVLSIV